MADRLKTARARQIIIDALKKDLMGPESEEEILKEDPSHNYYIIGTLFPKTGADRKDDYSQDQEVEADAAYGDGEDFTAGEDDDNEPVSVTHFEKPSSIGISFYVDSSTSSIEIDVSWGDYYKTKDTVTDEEGNEKQVTCYKRIPQKETVHIEFSDVGKSKEYRLIRDSNVSLHVSRIALKTGYSLVTVYVINKRINPESELEATMFQVELNAHSADGERVFIAEHICREVLAADEFYFEQRPILGRGRGCAASWERPVDGKSSYVKSDFIPQYEFPGVSAVIKGLDPYFFSMISLSMKNRKDDIIGKLNVLADSYEKWIKEHLIDDPKMADKAFADEIGNTVINDCNTALSRIREGIRLVSENEQVLDAFCFMNRVMFYQNSIKNYSKAHGKGIECSFKDFSDPRKKDPKDPGKRANDFAWRPFQIAFILMNLAGMVDPEHTDRELVDLLYFPTGGGKTEAYLGLMAFVIAFRRLRADTENEYNLDGGVTAILRYTLRLLTTQQRDRITKMIVAAEQVRQMEYPKYGKEPISIGFWVGGGVTPNSFSELDDPENPDEARRKRRLIYKQLLTCPFCGAPLKEENFYIDTERKAVDIYCSDEHCIFFRYKIENKQKIPVYLVDEEIYSRCPTIILSTVDKFARLPWDVKTNALFGRVDRLCSRDGYVAIGDEHKKHNKTPDNPASTLTRIKPFLPPELIIQDELHLITGPLGTVYGAYETIIEDMCSYKRGEKLIKPKYVVSTATIKNASEQTKCLYARERTSQFPPNGFEIGDSFFIREIQVPDSYQEAEPEKDPFRKYVGISAPGQSVKTTLLRVYASILQTAYNLSLQDEWKDVIDPYYTLIGYYNSIRELGGAVRLLQDDIPKRIKYLRKRLNMDKIRYLNRSTNVEITSRMSSYQIPEQLKKLETPYTERNCLDTAIATNMIAVGMDVDRLGLMVVTGQPKQNSEYIQATSRIGRSLPGLVVTLYNPYRPRDLSHYENFTGYHAQLYRFVEGTTATPFSARARDRVMHALVISAIRLKYPGFAANASASDIARLTDEQTTEVKALILDRLNIIKPAVRSDAESEIDQFIDWWKVLAAKPKRLLFKGPLYRSKEEKNNYLMSYYGQQGARDTEKPTLSSMREVESASNMFYYVEE